MNARPQPQDESRDVPTDKNCPSTVASEALIVVPTATILKSRRGPADRRPEKASREQVLCLPLLEERISAFWSEHCYRLQYICVKIQNWGCNHRDLAYLHLRLPRVQVARPKGDGTLFDEFDNFAPTLFRSVAVRPSAVGMVTTDRAIWIVMANPLGADPREVDRPARSEGRPMRICHEVLSDGRIRMGEIDPERESLLSEVLDEG